MSNVGEGNGYLFITIIMIEYKQSTSPVLNYFFVRKIEDILISHGGWLRRRGFVISSSEKLQFCINTHLKT